MNQRQLELQRDLYKLLLGTGEENGKSIDTCFSTALKLVVEITRARLGYIELRNPKGELWWSTYQCSEDDVEAIRERISSGIIAEAISSDETIVTPSAFLDPRFSSRESVQAGKIEAVLCSPISDGDSVGVIYLQGDESANLESSHSMMETELFARHITPLLRRLKYQVETTKPEDNLRKKYDICDIIGESNNLKDILHEAMTIAEIDVTVLITGETGTGKGLLAKAIHRNSTRNQKPFVHINCSNLPETLVESELFGAVKGAHSSAYQDAKGKIAAANGGTLFLDEIGELPISIQTKLLQFIEDGYYYPLGSQILTKADVRIITASNIDFSEAIKSGKFREDLYYRICVFPIEAPSLRYRSEDIPCLVHFFSDKYGEQFKLPTLEISQTTLLALKESEWPGNIRQLENKVQQGILRAKAEASSKIEMRHFLPEKKEQDVLVTETVTYRQGKDYWEKQFIVSRLEKYNWNISETARSLGLSRSHMNNLIKMHNLEREENIGS